MADCPRSAGVCTASATVVPTGSVSAVSQRPGHAQPREGCAVAIQKTRVTNTHRHAITGVEEHDPFVRGEAYHPMMREREQRAV